MKPTITRIRSIRWQKTALSFLFFLIIYGNNAAAQCWKQVETGSIYSHAIKDDGTLWGWGFNGGGQLGMGNAISQNAPVQVGTASDWASISASGHAMAIKTNGTLWSWGFSTTGALGTGNISQNSPVQVGTANNWAAVSAGVNYTMAIKTDGTLWAWGLNTSGQLGIGSNTSQTSPVQVGTATDWKWVTAGSGHTMAIKTDGTLWAWGSNGSGSLGIGNTTNSNVPVQVGTDTDWATVAAGFGFTGALKTNGTLWAWGLNTSGQLGIGNTTQQTSPVQVGTEADWATIATGNASTLAIKTSGTLWAWGQNTNGQLGIGNTTQQTSPVQVGTGTDWTAIATGNHSIALTAGKNIFTWGLNGNGQLGIGNTTQQNSPVLSGSSNYLPYVPALGGGTATLVQPASCNRPSVDGYYNFLDPATMVRKLFAIHPGSNTGNFTVVYDTSRNTNTTPLLQSNTVAASSLMGRLATVTYSSTLTTAVRVRFYYSSADSTSTSNALDAWISGQTGTTGKQWQWIQYEGDAAAMAAGQTANGFNAAYRVLAPDSSGVENGIRFVEFRNITSPGTFGAIALASTFNNIPAQCWKSIETGWTHTAAIKSDGTLWAWGTNNYGQRGTGSNSNSNIPLQVGAETNWATVELGYWFTMAIKTDGTLWAWGRNDYGQLGIGSTTNQNSPMQVGTDADWAYIAAGHEHSVAIKTDGSIWAWGRNDYGQLGIGNNTQQLTPVRVGTATDWKTVSAGAFHTMALKTDGTLWGWGYNLLGQLGNGNTTNTNSPVQAGAAADWATISAGMYHSLAVKADGTLWAWGRNNFGELGIGSFNNNQANPVQQVGTGNDWASVSTGSFHSLGIKTNGTLWGWGYNREGELGIGNITQQLSPVQVGTANNWVSASAGLINYTITLNTDGAIWGSGFNTAGQLGNGNNLIINTLTAGGATNYPAYLPGLGGGSATLVQPCGTDIQGYYQFLHPSIPSQKLFAIHPNGNAGAFTVVYDSSRNTNSSPLLQSDVAGATSLMGRLITVTYSTTIGAGMRVRFYYNATDSTNASNALDSWVSSNPGSVKQWQWIKYEGDAAAMVASQTASGFTGTYARLIPDSSGVEDGVSFVEFWNINSFSTFGAMAFTDNNVTLPVSLSSFTATLQDNCSAVKLAWTTDLEQNSKSFIIQRSIDGSSWSDIGTVTAAGNSGIIKKYSYSDTTVKGGGTYYYRLQMNDLDGQQKSSKVLSVKLNCSTDKYLIYPNPAKNAITIQSTTGSVQKALTVYNVAGQRMLQLLLNPSSVQTLDISSWKQGIYMVVISEKGKTVHAEKIIKQ